MKKKICILIIILLIPLLIVFSYKLYQYLRIKNAKIEITLVDNLTLEFNDEKKVSDYISSINGKIINDYIINSTKLGIKNIEFDFINDDNIKLKYSFDLEVVDTVKPIIWLDDSYSVVKNSNIDLTKTILCGDNYDSSPICTIEGEYDLTKVGKYPLIYKAVDESGNIQEKQFTLNVYDSKDNRKVTNTEYTNFDEYVKKYKNENTEIGVDVSTWQGDIDFEKLKNSGVEFIIIRIGWSDSEADEPSLDAKFEQNIKKANEYGIKAGIYFYSYAKNKKQAESDAKWVIKNIKPYKIDLPVAFDWEEWGNFNNYNLSFYELSNMAESYMDIISSKGYDAMLYSSKNYLEKIWFKTNHDIWLAHYTDQTNYQGKYKFWQVSSTGKVDGIRGAVDIDIRYIN